MRKLILLIVVGLALGALFGQLMMSVPGYWLVRVGDTSFQTSFWFGLVILLAIMWLVVGARTVRGAWRGDLFVAPCLKSGQ